MLEMENLKRKGAKVAEERRGGSGRWKRRGGDFRLRIVDFGFLNGREDFLNANGREMGEFFDHGFHGWARMEETWQFMLIRENP
jgi:hypothetical protein